MPSLPAESWQSGERIAPRLQPFTDDATLAAITVTGSSGRTLYSWRVELLPFLKEDALYKEFKKDEPWDGPHNLPLVERMPKVYAHPWASRKTPPGHTYYRVFVSPSAAQPRAVFLNGVPTSRGLFSHVPSQPILIVEAADPVPWTKPEELAYDPDKPLPKLGGMFKGGFNALFADATVHFIRRGADPELLRVAITRDDGKVLDLDKLTQ